MPRGRWGSFELRAYAAAVACDDPGGGEEGEQGDDGLGADAIEAPDLEQAALDIGEVKGVAKAGDGGGEQQLAEAEGGEHKQQRVAGDTNNGNGDAVEHGEAAVIDDAAVPVGVDVARLNVGRVVDPQGERRYDNA
jgi:hypothetical protein